MHKRNLHGHTLGKIRKEFDQADRLGLVNVRLLPDCQMITAELCKEGPLSDEQRQAITNYITSKYHNTAVEFIFFPDEANRHVTTIFIFHPIKQG